MNDLANGLAAVGAELTSDPTVVNPPVIEVQVDAPSRNLNPLVRDEAYRIGSEALRNAVKHAAAQRVTVTIYYEPRQFRLTVHDDGKGLDVETMAQQQTPGHFGLPGMRERASIVKGRFEVRSVPGAGTEIEVSVPAAIAYVRSVRRRWWRPQGK
jgi:signal transduction histidine kinase